MASEFEEAAEAAHDLIKEELLREGDEKKLQWIGWVALSTMVMALLSAVGALLAGVTASELVIERTEEILDVSHLEAAYQHRIVEVEARDSDVSGGGSGQFGG